ncbi:hypothetical protein Tco_1435604, partial [Tanacetum coccineum]
YFKISLSLAENVIVIGDDNHPPMLDKTRYSSWVSRMLLYMKGKEHGKLLVDSVLNGPFKYGTVVVPRNETTLATARERTYIDLTDEEKLMIKFRIVKLLIQGSNLSLQEQESKLYDDYDTFTSMPGESIHSDMHSTNFDHLYTYLRQHEAHTNEVRLMKQRYSDQIDLVANSCDSSPPCLNPTQYYPQLSPVAQQYYSPLAPQRSFDVPMIQ